MNQDSFEQVAKRAIDAVYSRLAAAARRSATKRDELWNDAVKTVLMAMAPNAKMTSSSSSDWAVCVQKELFVLMENNQLTLAQAKQVLKERMRKLIYSEDDLLVVVLAPDNSDNKGLLARTSSDMGFAAHDLQEVRKRLKLSARKRTWEELL